MKASLACLTLERLNSLAWQPSFPCTAQTFPAAPRRCLATASSRRERHLGDKGFALSDLIFAHGQGE
jgi:hypothetical protein